MNLPTNKSVQHYRAWKEAKDGAIDPRPDLLLTMELGDLMRARKDSSLEDSDPDFRQQYLDLSQSTDRSLTGEVGAGISRGARGLASTAMGAAALGLNVVGAKDTAKKLATKANEFEEGGGDNTPTIQKMGDVQDAKGAIRYAAGKVGEAVPSIGEAILAGVIGSAMGTAVEPGVGTAVGGIAGVIEKQAIKGLVKKGVQGLAKTATEAEVKAALKVGTNTALREAFTLEANSLAKRAGAAALGGANSLALSSGEIYNDTGDAGLSLGAGAIAAIPDTILPNYVMGKFFRGAVTDEMKQEAGNYFGRLLKDAAKTMPMEAGTEAFQELVGIAAKKYKDGAPAELTKDDITRLIEAGVGGAAGGLVAAPLAAAGGGESKTANVTQLNEQLVETPAMAARRRAAQQMEADPMGPPLPPAPKTRGEMIRDLARLDPADQEARMTVLAAMSKRTTTEDAELEVLRALAGQRPTPAVMGAPAAPATTGTVSPPPPPAVIPEAVAAIPPAAPAAATPANIPLVTPVAEVPKTVTAEEPKPDNSSAAVVKRTKQAGATISRLQLTVPTLDVSDALGKLQEIAKAGKVTPESLSAVEASIAALEDKVPAETARLAAARIDVASKKAANDLAQLNEKAEREAKRTMAMAERLAKKLNAPFADLPEDKPVTLNVRNTNGDESVWEAPARKAALVVDKQLEKLMVVMGKLKTEPLSAALKKQVKPDVIKFFEAEQAKLVTQGVEGKRASEMVIEQAIAEANGHLNEIYAQAGVTRPIPEPVIVANQLATLDNESPNFRPEPEVVPPPPAPVPKPILPPAPVIPAPPTPLPQLAAQLNAALNPAPPAAPAVASAAPRTKGFSFGNITNESKAVTSIQELDATGATNDKQGQRTRIGVALLAPDGKVHLRGLFNNKAATNGTALVATKGTGKGLVIQAMGAMKSKSKQVSASGKLPVLAPDLVAAGYKVIAQINFDLKTLPEKISEDFTDRADFDAAWGLTEKVVKGDLANTEKAQAEAAAIAVGDEKSKALKTEEAKLAAKIAKLQDTIDSSKTPAAGKKIAQTALAKAFAQYKTLTEVKANTEQTASATVSLDASPIEKAAPAPVRIFEDTPGGRIAQLIAADPKMPGGKITLGQELYAKMKANAGDATTRDMEAFIGKYISNAADSEDVTVEREDAVNHVQNAWYGAKTGKTYDRDTFIQLLKQSDPMADDDVSADGRSAAQAKSTRADSDRIDSGKNIAQRAQDAVQFRQLLDNLRQQGYQINLIEDAMGVQSGQLGADGVIRMVVHDAAAGNLTNVVTLIHELAHDQLGAITAERKAALMRATNATIATVLDGNLVYAAVNANASPEEKLVETLAIKLAEEGFGAKSDGLAAAIWRSVKQLYFRAANAMLTAMGKQPGDAFVLAWFENQLRRKLGGDYDYRFADLISPFQETKAQRSQRYTRIGGAPVADFLDPITNKITQGEVLPDTADAAEWNVDHATLKGEGDMSRTESDARITAAAWNEIMPLFVELKAEFGTKLTDQQFWARFATGDMPAKILARMDARAPGSAVAKISDVTMTEAMAQQARYRAYTIAQSMASRAKRKYADRTEHANKVGDELVDKAKALNKIEREFRDANVVNAHFNDQLRALIKELALDLDRGPDTAFKAGTLLGAIRTAEKMTDDQAVPEEYQRLFKTILDSDGTTSLFNKLEAISKLDLPLASPAMTVPQVVEAIRANAVKDPVLQSLVSNKPMLIALASLAKGSAREMSLLQLRTLKDTTQFLAIKAQLDEIREASDERLEQLEKDIGTSQSNQSLADRLRSSFLKARREFRETQRQIRRAEEVAEINRRVAERMEAKATQLSKDVGAFSNWQMHDGATYMAMQQKENGEWVTVNRTLRMIGDTVAGQREQIRHDLALNTLWLEANTDKQGTRHYEEVKRQTNEIGVAGIGDREYRASHRFLLDKVLQPLGQRFASTGRAAGYLIQQQLNRWLFITKSHADEIEAKSRKWTNAFAEAQAAAGYTYAKDFMQEIYDPVIYAIESEAGRDEKGALRVAVQTAYRRMPAGVKPKPEFKEKLGNLMRATKDINERLHAIAEKQGVYTADKRLKDPLTGKETLNRHAIKYGWLTNTRRLRAIVIRTLVNEMTATGWSKGMFDGLPAAEMEDGDFRALVDQHFTDNIKRVFVDPFTSKPGKEVFFGADLGNGERAYVSQLMAREVWEDSDGDVLKFIDTLFDKTNQADNRDGLNDYRVALLQRFAFLYEMESKIAAKTEQVKDVSNPDGPKSHRIMDGRTNDLIPPEHFTYDVYDPTSARIALAEIAFHAAFGRDGAGLNHAAETLRMDLKKDAEAYARLNGSEREKRARAAASGLDFKRIERAYQDRRNVDTWMNQVVAYFGGKNQSGATGDAKTALELLQLNTQLVLGNTKSGLWNLLSIADFPLAFRGLNKSSLGAMKTAVGTLGRNVFGSLLETVGIDVIRASEYAKEIAQINEARQTERLPFGVYMADIGKGGSFEDSKGERVTQGIRYFQQLLRKGFKAGKGEGEFAGNNALWSPFTYINTQVASAIATGNVQTFEVIVKKMVNYFAAHPEAFGNPSFKFTAEMLGMKGAAFFSDEGAFDFYRRGALDYRLGSIEDVARGAVARLNKGERILTRDQVLGIALMATNEISLESSINSRPAEMYNNGVLRFGGMLMGWPLAKVNLVNQSLKTSEGRLDALSILKGAGIMAAWSLPIGLAYSLLMDRYDDEILKKKSNLRAIDPIAAVPLVGPALALAGVGGDRGLSNAFGMLERSAKGGLYGIVGDMANSFANVVDPTASQRDFDLNSRVLAYSQYANLRDIARNLIHQDGEITYSSVIRPLITTLGGGGLLQYQQILNAGLGLTNAESEVTNRINVSSYLRAAGRETGIELKMGAGRTSPTPTSVWVREMQLCALSNDRLGFLEAYRNAVEVARKEGEADPEGKILEAWKGRDPIKSVFARVPTELEREKLMAALGEDGRRIVMGAEELFARYTESIEPSPFDKMMQRKMNERNRAMAPFDPLKLRRQMALRGMGY